ncbi:MAG: FAD-dependent oxidoreductase [Butyrivibrio sp.]|nr:FAD-dependent oxidoreductase [Butyrivibrio sp.]
MIRISQIKIPIEINNRLKAQSEVPGKSSSDDALKSALRKKAAKILRIDAGKISQIEIVKHSIDARKKPELYDVYVVDLKVHGEKNVAKKCRDRNVSVIEEKKYDFLEKVSRLINVPLDCDEHASGRIVIVGAGPAGLFCGYELAKHGYKPIIIERGADVDKRSEIVEKFWESGELDLKTNVQFGEGGAGTFSDGKLNTMVKDKEGRGAEALRIFAENGAPERIKYESKPHIGTDILKNVVKNIRNEIIACGGQVLFETQLTELITDADGRLTAIKVSGVAKKDASAPDIESTIKCDAVVLAIGHSARDTFVMLKEKSVDMQPKPFAVGFRVEHPQGLINLSQYGIDAPDILPAAPYKLTTTTKEGKGVYSFCMCPGGYVVNASSEEGRLCVNGMSYSKRDGNNANSAIIITVDPKDFGSEDVLAGVEFQRNLEKRAFDLAGGKIPVEYYGGFKRAVNSANTDEQKNHTSVGATQDNTCSIDPETFTPQMKGAYEFAAVHTILPKDLNEAFVEGMENFGRTIKGYNDAHALVSGVESRTSSPVRINRGDDGQSLNIKGLFPCGEGAGYAGGIMSAAMDGIRTAELVAAQILL